MSFLWEATSCKKKKKNLVSWLVGTMPKVWMHQKLWRKFAIIEVALAFYCAWDGAWESINSVHQTAPGRSSVVNISHHHQFPKQQLPPQEKKSHCKIHIHTRILSYFSSPVLVKRYYITKKIFLSSLQGAWADIKRRDHQCDDIFVIPRVEYRCIANYIQLNIFEDLRALDFKREKKFFGNSSDYWRYRHLYHEWAYCVKRSTV